MSLHTQEAWFDNPAIWVALGFAIFIPIFMRYVYPMLVGALDGRTDAIRTQLEQASKLRTEAEEVLENFKKKQAEMEIEAARMIEEAKIEAENMAEQAKQDLAQMIVRRGEQAERKIALMEKEASAEIRAKMAQIATDAAQTLITQTLDKADSDPLTKRGIQFLVEESR
jgi:F-type H+-transporting ATPase subunit b